MSAKSGKILGVLSIAAVSTSARLAIFNAIEPASWLAALLGVAWLAFG